MSTVTELILNSYLSLQPLRSFVAQHSKRPLPQTKKETSNPNLRFIVSAQELTLR